MDAIPMIGKTGFVYPKRTEDHHCPWDPLHAERPERTKFTMQRLRELNENLIAQCHTLQARLATKEEVKLVHTPELVEIIHETCSSDPGKNSENLKAFSERFNDVYICQDSEDCALLAAGSTIDLLDALQRGVIRNGLAVVRPPGHHASSVESNGFCLFNNVAVGARYLTKKYGLTRILIVDWDIHHGQGTQRIFYDDKRVLYFSIHRYENGEFWPNLEESNFDYVGGSKAAGYNINVPLNEIGLGDAEYMAIFQQVLLPVAYEFNPEMIIVSAGYDSAIGCPEGRMRVSPAMYGHLTHALCSVADGKVAVILEGGYCVDSLAESVVCTLEALMGYPCQILPGLSPPDSTVVTSILNVISAQRKYWKSLALQEWPATCNAKARAKLPCHSPEVVFHGLLEEPANEAYGATPFYSPSEVVDIRHEINALKMKYDRFRQGRPKVRTCYSYDEFLLKHCAGERDEKLLDVPERISAIHEHLEKTGLLQGCVRVKTKTADLKDLSLNHSPEYVQLLCTDDSEVFLSMVDYQKTSAPSEDRWDSDLFVTEGTSEAVRRAVGSLQSVVNEVVQGRVSNGFAIVRPPGHHAHAHYPAGFCFANNVAIVAKQLLESGQISRILIVDWDIHHGDGVQEAFYEEPRVLYVSLHLAGKENDYYPTGPNKDVAHTGKGYGRGMNINIPWRSDGKTDGDYISAFLNLVMPVAYQFGPEIVLVCCGFDGGLGDFGQCALSPAGYWTMTSMLMSLAGGKLVLSLEGGYHLDNLRKCSEAVMRALIGQPMNGYQAQSLVPSESAMRDIKRAVDVQQRFWPALQYRAILHNVSYLSSHLEPLCPKRSSAKAYREQLQELSSEEEMHFSEKKKGVETDQ